MLLLVDLWTAANLCPIAWSPVLCDQAGTGDAQFIIFRYLSFSEPRRDLVTGCESTVAYPITSVVFYQKDVTDLSLIWSSELNLFHETASSLSRLEMLCEGDPDVKAQAHVLR